MAESCPFDVTPLAQPRVINTVPVLNINYTNQDYRSLKARFLELLKNNFDNDFNYMEESSLAVMLIEVYSALADMLSFKIDQWGNEFFFDTAREFENILRLGKFVGFKPLPPLPAKAMFMAKINSPYSSDISLPTPLKVGFDDLSFDISYELFPADDNNDPVFNSDIVIPAGGTFTSAIVGLEGRTKSSKFKSKGTPNQIFTLQFENVFHGSIRVYVDNALWHEVDSFTEHTPRPEYCLEYDAHYKPSIIFGNNKAGLIPPEGSEISVSSRIAGTNTSEIVSGAINTKTSTSLLGVSHPIIVNISNYTKSEFGYPGDGINEIRKKVPAYLRTQNRAVTGADYKYMVDSFASPHNGAVGKSTVVLRNHGCAANVIDVIILAKTGQQRLVKANDNLRNELAKFLTEKKMFTDYVCVKDGEVVSVDVSVDLRLDVIYKKYERELHNKVMERIDSFFNINNWEFGKTLKEKDIIKYLADLKEIREIDISFTTPKSVENKIGSEDVVTASYNEIIRPDSVNISFVYTNSVE